MPAPRPYRPGPRPPESRGHLLLDRDDVEYLRDLVQGLDRARLAFHDADETGNEPARAQAVKDAFRAGAALSGWLLKDLRLDEVLDAPDPPRRRP